MPYAFNASHHKLKSIVNETKNGGVREREKKKAAKANKSNKNT